MSSLISSLQQCILFTTQTTYSAVNLSSGHWQGLVTITASDVRRVSSNNCIRTIIRRTTGDGRI
jgi:hypothetical protein